VPPFQSALRSEPPKEVSAVVLGAQVTSTDRRAVHADQRQRGGERAADGRREPENYLHLGSDRGGRTAVVLMSLVRSGRGLGKVPHAYLHDVLNRVGTHPASRDDDLSPDRRMLPGR